MSSDLTNELRDWLEAVGRARFTRETGKSHQTVHRAVVKGVFPPGWYISVRTWCAKNGIECPEHLFDWTPSKAPTTKQCEYCGGDFQAVGDT